MIAITDHADGCILPLRAQLGARRNAIVGEQAGALKVAVTAPPEDGRANQALVELLHESFGLKRSQIELIAGQTSREKRFLIRGLTSAQLGEKIAATLK